MENIKNINLDIYRSGGKDIQSSNLSIQERNAKNDSQVNIIEKRVVDMPYAYLDVNFGHQNGLNRLNPDGVTIMTSYENEDKLPQFRVPNYDSCDYYDFQQNHCGSKIRGSYTQPRPNSIDNQNSNTNIMKTVGESCKSLQIEYPSSKEGQINSVVKGGVGAAIMAQILCEKYSKNFEMFEGVGVGGSIGRIDPILISLQYYVDSNDKGVSDDTKIIIKYSKKNRGTLINDCKSKGGKVDDWKFIAECIVGDAARLLRGDSCDIEHLSIKELNLSTKDGKNPDGVLDSLKAEAKKMLTIIKESEKNYDHKKGSFYRMVSGKYFGNKGCNIQKQQSKNDAKSYNHQSNAAQQPQSNPVQPKVRGMWRLMKRNR